MKSRPEDCDHDNAEGCGAGYAYCPDCGITMPDGIPPSQLEAWGVTSNKLFDDPEEEDDATGE